MAGAPAGDAAGAFPEVRRTERDALPGHRHLARSGVGLLVLGVPPGRRPDVRRPDLRARRSRALARRGRPSSPWACTAPRPPASPGSTVSTVRLNGSLLGEAQWQGIAPRRATFAVPAGLLLADRQPGRADRAARRRRALQHHLSRRLRPGLPRGLPGRRGRLTFAADGNSAGDGGRLLRPGGPPARRQRPAAAALDRGRGGGGGRRRPAGG